MVRENYPAPESENIHSTDPSGDMYGTRLPCVLGDHLLGDKIEVEYEAVLPCLDATTCRTERWLHISSTYFVFIS
jgi:hypothetical protein